MNESDIACLIADSLSGFTEDITPCGREPLHGIVYDGAEIETYEEAGILSRDAVGVSGLVIRIAGKTFHVTISGN
jgi:hypothetical protein